MSGETAASPKKTIVIKGGALENGILISRKESRSATAKKLKLPKTNPDSKKLSQGILDEIRKKYLDNLKNKEEQEPVHERESVYERELKNPVEPTDIKELLDSDAPQDKDFVRSMDFLEKLSQQTLTACAIPSESLEFNRKLRLRLHFSPKLP